MPQLMPLMWMMSSMMMLILMISASVIYSEKMLSSSIKYVSTSINKSMNFWCW